MLTSGIQKNLNYFTLKVKGPNISFNLFLLLFDNVTYSEFSVNIMLTKFTIKILHIVFYLKYQQTCCATACHLSNQMRVQYLAFNNAFLVFIDVPASFSNLK